MSPPPKKTMKRIRRGCKEIKKKKMMMKKRGEVGEEGIGNLAEGEGGAGAKEEPMARKREKDEEEKSESENDGEAVAKRLSFLETTTSTPTSYEAVKVHWMEKVPDAALSTKFSSESGENKRSFEQWSSSARALRRRAEELRVKQVVAGRR